MAALGAVILATQMGPGCNGSATPPTAVLSAAGALPQSGMTGFPRIRLVLVSEGELHTPIGMTHAWEGSGRLFFVDQRGKIQIIRNGSLLPTPFLDLEPKLVSQRRTGAGGLNFDERGLPGLAFHPEYAMAGASGEGKFYVNYSAPHPDAPGTTTAPIDHPSVLGVRGKRIGEAVADEWTDAAEAIIALLSAG